MPKHAKLEAQTKKFAYGERKGGIVRLVIKTFLLLVGFILLNAGTLFSDEVGLKDDEDGGRAVELKGHLNLGGTATVGNTDTENYYLDGELVARTEKNRYTADAILNYGKDEDEKTVDNWTASIKHDYFLSGKWYLCNNALFTKDEFKDLNLRTSLGTGAGYQFRESELVNLSVEAGLSYVNEDLIEDEDNSYPAGRWSANFDKYLLPERVKFFHFHEILIGLGDDGDTLIRTQTGFRFPLLKSFVASTQFNYDREENPAAGKEKADTMYILTLGYEW